MSTEAKEKDFPQVCFDEFAVPAYEDWKQEATLSLKGGVFEKKLFTKTYEEIQLEPIYTMKHVKNSTNYKEFPGFDSCIRGTMAGGYLSEPWKISQECDEVLPECFNELLKQELKKGATAVHVRLNDKTCKGEPVVSQTAGSLGERGLVLSTLDDAAQAFEGIDVSKYPIQMYAGASAVAMIALLSAMLKAKGEKSKGLKGCIGADPVGTWIEQGTLPCSLDALYDEMAHTLIWSEKHMPNLRTILVRGEVYHDGGANALQELGYALTTAIEYIRAMQRRGIHVNQTAKQIRFSFSLGANFFMEVAKLRAARVLWSRIVETFGGDEQARKMNIHARTSAFTKTVYDPYVNMLRTTTEAFSGIVGGVESLQVGTFDEAVRFADDFSRRIARNTQILLQNECNLLQPVDPAGGSWYIETLTNQIAEKTWQLLQAVEGDGGLVKVVQRGIPQKAIDEVLARRFSKLALRSDRAVGINMYANIQEQPLENFTRDIENFTKVHRQQVLNYSSDTDRVYCESVLQELAQSMSQEIGQVLVGSIEAFTAGALVSEVTAALRQDEEPEAKILSIKKHRWAEQFEKLRKKTEIHTERTGNRFKIFLANMGKIPQHKARADFSTGFMEVAGFEVLKNDGFPTVEEAVKAAAASGAQATVICSTDDTYPEIVPALTKQIKELNPEMIVILAGAPAPEWEEAYKEAGVDEYIHIRANCFQILSWLQWIGGME